MANSQHGDSVASESLELEPPVGIGRHGTVAADPRRSRPGRLLDGRDSVAVPIKLAGGEQGIEVHTISSQGDLLDANGRGGDRPALAVDDPATDRQIVPDQS